MAHLATPPQPALAALNRAPAQLWLPRISLSQCIRAVVTRSTLGVGRDWPPAWCENHFPASPLCGLSWFIHGHTDLLHADGRPPQRLPPIYFSGPFTQPTRSRNTPEGQGLMLMLLPDAVQALTGLDPSQYVNRCVPAEDVLDDAWMAMARAVREAPDDATRVGLIEAFLEPRWQALRPGGGATGRPHLQDWAQGLALRAAASGVGRETRRVTGFAPGELRRRIAEEEGFWIYRVWG